MSLRVWLPLTKDLRQQGLSNVTVTNYGATLDNNGKLGKCYLFDGTDDAIGIGDLNNICPDGNFSFACWFYKSEFSSKGYDTIFGGPSGFELETKNGTTNSNVIVPWNWGKPQIAYEFDKWYHLVMTRTSSGTTYYLNGEQVATGTAGTIPAGNYFIGAWNTATQQNYKGKLNDVRIYDHCLSPMEVKELAKGLVLHYPLNRGGLGPSNLLKNGFGELGSENWNSSTNISTSDIPSGQSDIKASFGNGYAIEHINIYPTHTYKFSTWIKGTSTSGYTYPSLFPYDVDGKFIDYHKCSDGFNLNTMTTLKQQLKTGDTKIYVNDLSQWNANSGHYYNWAAIFSYTDSTGYTYPDGTYTQNLGRFGSSTTAKTNLDKTNNIITLTTAYTGPNMPVGTKLCASTEGSTYYYPLGGINLANIQDWTYKEGTFSASTARLKYAKYVTFWTYSSNRMAGIKIVDLTNEEMDSTTEYDCSGYCNNGTRTGTFSWTSDTPKYQVSTYMSKTALITHPRPVFGGTDQEWTCAMWVKLDNVTQGQQAMNNFNISNNIVHSTTPLLYLNDGTNDYYMYGSQAVSAGVWTHIVFVFKNSDGTRNVYINGVLKNNYGPNKTSIPKGIPETVTVGTNLAGYISDYRVYATALSADDVKSLYQNSAYIDSSGNIYGTIHEV